MFSNDVHLKEMERETSTTTTTTKKKKKTFELNFS